MGNLKKNMIGIYGSKGEQWFDQLPFLTKKISSQWGLSDLQPVSNLSFNYVLSGFRNKQPIILKIGLDTDNLNREAQALKIFNDHGGVRLLDQQEGALLIERMVPGESLKKNLSTQNLKPVQIACELTQKLHKAPLPTQSIFPYINDQLKILDKDWNIPNHYLKKARTIKNKLLKAPGRKVFLHGDLHHDNILKNGDDWVVIDPKGVIGYEINEVWAFVMNIEEDTKFIADYFKFDLDKVRQWYFVHLMLACVWDIEDNKSPNHFLELAKKTYSLYNL